MKKPHNYLLGLLLTIFVLVTACFQSLSVASNEIIPFDSNRWQINALESRVEDYLGKKSLFLKGGFAVVKDSEFTDGIIEYDVAFEQKPGFIGAVWRLQDLKNYEIFYMRPHQSGNPDASQYTPFFNDVNAFQLYYGDGYSAKLNHSFNQWMHVKIVVSGKSGEVYVDDMEKPGLVMPEFKRELESGKVGLFTFGRIGDQVFDFFAPAYFANFSYTSTSNPPLKGPIKTPEKAPEGTIMSWFVSNSFEAPYLDNKYQLSTQEEEQKLNWTKLATDISGMTNLARVQGIKDGKNTVFARTTIVSDSDTIKQLKYGYSDKVKVYLNGQLLYGGTNEFQTRDYRFLGTIGLFDELYLPLKKGENELWMAVSEGELWDGWGLIGQINNPQGISFNE